MAVACEHNPTKNKTRYATRDKSKHFHASWDFYLFIVKKATLFLTITDNRGYKRTHEKNMKNWIPISSIPKSGKEYVLEPAADWSAVLAEFKLPYDVHGLKAIVHLFPQEDGILARGEFKGEVIMPCTRCAEDAHVYLDQRFDTFEPYPIPENGPSSTNASDLSVLDTDKQRPKVHGAWKPEAQKKRGKETRQAERDATEQDESDDLSLDVDENVIRISAHGLEMNIGNLAFEEFLLALPVKALCSEDCKGLCPKCGHNLNTGQCACSRSEGDPRLAALRNLTLGKK